VIALERLVAQRAEIDGYHYGPDDLAG